VLDFLSESGNLDGKLRVRTMELPDRFIEHGTQYQQLEEAGLLKEDIVKCVAKAFDPVKYSSDKLEVLVADIAKTPAGELLKL
jgi:deoxyxylulose-5-phosphate synthase